MTDTALQVCLLHQGGHGDVQRAGKTNERQHGHIVVTALNAANITSIHFGQQREPLLRNSFGFPDAPERFTERHQCWVLSAAGEVWHQRMIPKWCAIFHGPCTAIDCKIEELLEAARPYQANRQLNMSGEKMTTPSKNENMALLRLFLNVVFYGAIVIGFGGYAFVAAFGNPFQSLMGDNLLEAATRVGKSTKAQLDAFKNAGGLDNESSWKGYHVRSLETVFDEAGILGMLNLRLNKSWPQKKIASVDNLKSTLAQHCGSDWEVSSLLNVATAVSTNTAGGRRCSLMDQGKDELLVNISRTDLATEQPVATGLPEPKPTTTIVAIVQPTQSTSALVAAPPGQFIGSYEGPGDGATVTINIASTETEGKMNVAVDAAAGGCSGSAGGNALFEGPVLRLDAKNGELHCVASMQFNSSGQLVLEEGAGCHQFHGAQCGFSAVLTKTSSTPVASPSRPAMQLQLQPPAAPQRSAVQDEACTRAQARCREKSPAMAQACLNALVSVRGCE